MVNPEGVAYCRNTAATVRGPAPGVESSECRASPAAVAPRPCGVSGFTVCRPGARTAPDGIRKLGYRIRKRDLSTTIRTQKRRDSRTLATMACTLRQPIFALPIQCPKSHMASSLEECRKHPDPRHGGHRGGSSRNTLDSKRHPREVEHGVLDRTSVVAIEPLVRQPTKRRGG